jgi:hypothetical protein
LERRSAAIGVPVALRCHAYLCASISRAARRAKTPIQTHPGSESFYVLTGKLGQRTPQGESQVASHASIK